MKRDQVLSCFNGVLLFLLLTSLVVLLLLAAPFARVQAGQVLEFLEEELTLSPDADQEGKVAGTVTVYNKGPAVSGLTFKAVLAREDGTPYGEFVTLNVDPTCELEDEEQDKPCIEANTAARFAVAWPPAETLTETLTGHMYIEAAEDVQSQMLPLTVTPTDEKSRLSFLTFTSVIWIGLALGVLSFVVCLAWLLISYPGDDRTYVLGGHLGELKWNFTENWVANVTGLSAIVGATILTLEIAPETLKLLAAGEFKTLNAIHGIGITVAPLVGAILTTLFPRRGQEGVTRVWIYLVAVALVVWAVVGQLLVGLIYMEDIGLGKPEYHSAVYLLQVLIVLLAVFAFVYAIRKTVTSALKIILERRRMEAVASLFKYIADGFESVAKAGSGKELEEEVSKLANRLGTVEDWMLAGLEAEKDQGIGKGVIQVSVFETISSVRTKIVKFSDNPDGKAAVLLVLQKTHDGLEKVLDAMQASEEDPWAQSLSSAIIELHDGVQGATIDDIRGKAGIGKWADDLKEKANETLKKGQVAFSAKGPTTIYLP